jgi:hypothetical protein
MQVISLPNRRTPRNSPSRGAAVAVHIRDGANISYPGLQHSPNERCTMCGRPPRAPRRQLFCIKLDTINDRGVLLGVGVCHRRILGNAIRRLIAREQAFNDPTRAAGILRLQDALVVLGC